jgi:hypothetical protein
MAVNVKKAKQQAASTSPAQLIVVAVVVVVVVVVVIAVFDSVVAVVIAAVIADFRLLVLSFTRISTLLVSWFPRILVRAYTCTYTHVFCFRI